MAHKRTNEGRPLPVQELRLPVHGLARYQLQHIIKMFAGQRRNVFFGSLFAPFGEWGVFKGSKTIVLHFRASWFVVISISLR